MTDDRKTLNIKMAAELRERLERCARAEGLKLPEYARVCLMEGCRRTEARAAGHAAGPLDA